MLQNIHEKIKGWFAIVIFAFVAVAFLLWGVQYYINSNPSGIVAAKVDGAVISNQQVESLFERMSVQYQQMTRQALNLAQQQQLKQVALKQLIDQTLLVSDAKKMGFVVDPGIVESLIANNSMFQVNGQFSPGLYQQTLAANSITPQAYEQQVQQEQLLQQFRAGLMVSNFALPAEIQQSYRLMHQTRDFGYFVVPASNFKDPAIADADIEQYYQQNPAQFTQAARVKISYVLLDPTEIAKNVQPSAQEINDFYQANRANFRTPNTFQIQEIVVQGANTESAVQDIVKKLEHGVPFAQVAKVSQRSITLNDASAELQKILANMQPGQISVPFSDQTGTHLVRLVAIQSGRERTFAEVKESIFKNLQSQAIQNLLSSKSDQLANLTFTHPDSLQSAAQALNLPVQTTDWFTQEGPKKDILANPEVIKAAFAANVLQGNNSDLITLKNGNLLVLRVDQYQPQQLLPLGQVKQIIVHILQTEAARQQAARTATEIMTSMQEGVTPQALAKQYGLVWKVKNNATRIENGIDPAILTAVFHARLGDQKTNIADIVLNNGDSAVVQLIGVHAPTDSLPDAASAQLGQQISQMTAASEYQLYQQSLLAHVKIEQK